MPPKEKIRASTGSPSSKLPLTKEVLKESAEELRRLIDKTPNIIFTIDLKGNFLFGNKTAQKIIGTPLSELLKTSIWKLIAPEHHDLMKNLLNQVPKRKHVPFFQVDAIASDGRRIPLEVHTHLIEDKKNNIVGVQGIAIDITERKWAEQELRRERKAFRIIAEAAVHATDIPNLCRRILAGFIEVLEFDFGTVRLYDQKKKLLQRTAVVGLSKEEVKKKVRPQPLDDPRNIAALVARTQQAIFAPNVNKHKILHTHKSRLKELGIRSLISWPILGTGQNFLGVMQIVARTPKKIAEEDRSFFETVAEMFATVLERKLAEEALRRSEEALRKGEEKFSSLTNQLPIGVYRTTNKGKFLHANPALASILEYKSAEELMKTSAVSAYNNPRERIKQLKQWKASRRSVCNELEFRTKKGRLIWVRDTGQVILDKKGEIDYIDGTIEDITERRQAEEALRESEFKYSALVEQALDGVLIIQDGIYKFVNRAILEISGYSMKEMIGTPFLEIVAPEFKDKIAQRYKLRMAGKKVPSVYEAKIKRKDGTIKDIEISAGLIQYQGKPANMAVIRDITERKKSEERIKEMSQQIEKFSAISADILSIEDEEKLFKGITNAVVDISDFNRALISFFKDDPPYREIIGCKGIKKVDLERLKKIEMPPEKYLKFFEKGIKIGSQSCYIPHYMKHILDQKAVIYGKKTYPSKKGYWHREDNLLVSMNDEEGKLIGIISVDDSKSGLVPTDETVRPLEIFANLISGHIQHLILARKIKESEEKYRELVSNVKVGIFRTTPEGKLLEVNPAGAEMFGYGDSTHLFSVKVDNLYENPEERINHVNELEENGIVKSREIKLKKKDGSTFWATITSTAIRDITGKIMYHDTVIEDIAERKKLEDDVKRLSITDELTGLYNRRYFNQNLPKEIKKAERWRSYLSFIMIDIDDFKQYNDLYHHLQGDVILKEIARVISKDIREDIDWASRFGGEEFSIILPGVKASEAFFVAERIRKNFQKIEFKPKGKVVHKTISLGIADCHFPESKIPHSFKNKRFRLNYEKIATNLTNIADKALFQAKKAGKNKTVISESSIELSYSSS